MELAQIFFKDGRPIDLEGRLNPETCASLFWLMSIHVQAYSLVMKFR